MYCCSKLSLASVVLGIITRTFLYRDRKQFLLPYIQFVRWHMGTHPCMVPMDHSRHRNISKILDHNCKSYIRSSGKKLWEETEGVGSGIIAFSILNGCSGQWNLVQTSRQISITDYKKHILPLNLVPARSRRDQRIFFFSNQLFEVCNALVVELWSCAIVTICYNLQLNEYFSPEFTQHYPL